MAPEPARVTAAAPTPMRPGVWACVVCFHATDADIRPLLKVLEPQVDVVLVLDNSPQFAGRLFGVVSPRTRYLPMRANLGTAGAMNEAWRQAVEGGADYVISFDQDSRPDSGLVQGLRASLERLAAAGERVAAIGPKKVDPRTGRPMRLLLPVNYRKRYASADTGDVVRVDHLISSGCLISMEAFQEVGPYDEALFLDYVDVEWCLRARAAGFAIVCDARLSMRHVIGDQVIRIGSRSVWIHRPERNGLLVRNHLLLWRLPAASVPWLLSDLRLVIVKVLVHLAMAPPRRSRLRAVLRGLVDGIRGAGGPM